LGDGSTKEGMVLGELSSRTKSVAMSPKRIQALREKLSNVLSESQFRTHVTDPDKVPVKSVGLDAGIFSENLNIDPLYAPFIEQMFKNTQTIFTPYATQAMQRQLKSMHNIWKASATVARPSFHVRNWIGGVYNGYIAGVRPQDYFDTIQDVITFRRALKKLNINSVEDVTGDVMNTVWDQLSSDRARKMFKEAWEQDVLSTSFTRAEHLYDPTAGLSIKPWETNFALFAKGGQTMEFTEDWLRMAAFSRWFDDGAADLFDEGFKAKTIVNSVHFDYTDLTSQEEWVKAIMPFYVWTRRNVPLQLRMLVQEPSHMMWFYRARSNWNEQQLQGMSDTDPFARQASNHGFIMPFTRNNDYGWSRVMWDPQLPMYDLDMFPWGEGPIGWVNLSWMMSALTDQLGPGLSVPYTLSQQAEEAGGTGTNAKAGLNFVMESLNRIPGINTDVEGYAPTASMAPDTDYRVSKWFNGLTSTMMPYYDDWRAFLGVVPNNPYRAAGEGWLPGEQQENIDLKTRMMLGPLGRTFGRGAGLSWYTTQQAKFDADLVSDEINRRRESAQFEIGHPTSSGQPYESEYTDEEIARILGQAP